MDTREFDPGWETRKESIQSTKLDILERARKIREELTNAANTVARTPEGLIVFKHLCQWLDFKGSSLNITAEGINPQATIYNEARRKVWIDFRELLDVDHRNNIEKD